VKRRLVTAGLVLSGIAALAGATPAGRPEAPRPAEPPAPGRHDAAKLYRTACARCHKLYDATAYPDAAWRTWLEKMIAKARLNPEQAAIVARHAEILRAGSGPPSPPAGK
jgi:mono/diheme cytochrome c family protein